MASRKLVSLRSAWSVVAVLVALAATAAGAPPEVSAAGAQVSRPNLVLVVTDDQTFESLTVAMPYLNGRPGGHWVDFSNAVVNVPLCCPSRATILSGQYSDNTGVRSNAQGDLFDDTSTLATWLHDGGYFTGLVGKYLNEYPWDRGSAYVPPGWDRWYAFDNQLSDETSTGYVLNENGTSVSYGTRTRDYTTDVLRSKAERFLRTAPEPFFLYFATRAPHSPFTPADRHRDALADVPPHRPPNFNEADISDKPTWVQALPLMTEKVAAGQDADRARAWRSLLAVDEAIGGMMAKLSERGALDDTVIVFMSDNGLSFGEHRWKESKVCPYEECIHVPLLVRYPTAVQRTLPNVVSNIDIAPTLAELAGVTPTRAIDGRSLVPLLEGADVDWIDEAYITKPSGGGGDGGGQVPDPNGPTSNGYTITQYSAIRTREWKYISYRNGDKELYDLVNDPYELTNRAAVPAYRDVRLALKARLEAIRPP